jgi:hypothetical protein
MSTIRQQAIAKEIRETVEHLNDILSVAKQEGLSVHVYDTRYTSMTAQKDRFVVGSIDVIEKL